MFCLSIYAYSCLKDKKNINGKYNFELKQKKVYVEIEWALYGRHKFAQGLNLFSTKKGACQVRIKRH